MLQQGKEMIFIIQLLNLPDLMRNIDNSWLHKHELFSGLAFYGKYGPDISVFSSPLIAPHGEILLQYCQNIVVKGDTTKIALIREAFLKEHVDLVYPLDQDMLTSIDQSIRTFMLNASPVQLVKLKELLCKYM